MRNSKLLFMKKFQLIALTLIGIYACLNLSSCKKDERDEPETPKVEKRMKSLDDIEFTYSNGKIIDETGIKIKYTSTSIEISGNHSQGVYTIQNGLVSKYVESDGWYNLFKYENGYLSKRETYDYEGNLREDVTFEWKDGLITRQTEYDFDDDGKKRLFCDYKYTYTSNPDYGGAVVCFQSNSLFYDYLPQCLILQGYFGKLPKFLVSSAVDASGYFDKDEYSWDLDSDGYPLELKGDYRACFVWEKI